MKFEYPLNWMSLNAKCNHRLLCPVQEFSALEDLCKMGLQPKLLRISEIFKSIVKEVNVEKEFVDIETGV